MANCPNCGIYLQTVRNRAGIYAHCSQCDGRAVTYPQIRQTTGDRYLNTIIRQVRNATQTSRPCPYCENPMKSFLLPDPPVALEGCMSCTMVWFDGGKFEQLPEGVAETPETAMFRAIESEAKWRVEQQKIRNQAASLGQPPDEWWKWIPAVLGMPVKFDNVEMSQRPWATWALSAIIAFISIAAFPNLRDAVDNYGFIPAEAWRYGGATFLTSFFLHGGIFHLVGNLYFFILFGGEVEEFLGCWRFLALIFLSALVGDFMHLLGNLNSEIPCIGASGGISGVLVFYALKFPGSRLAFFWWRVGWIQLPAWCAFFLWFLMQLVGLYLQKAGLSHVSSMAHLGGVTTGFALWLWWRKLKPRTETEPAEQY